MNIQEQWYAVYTNPRSEAKVAERIKEIGVEVYLPMVTELKQWSDRKKKVTKPLFTSYVFVRIENRSFDIIKNIYGVVGFIRHIGQPAKIRDVEIDAIKLFLNKVNTSTIEFEPADSVEIKEGLFKGKSGIIQYVGKDHLRIVLSELKLSIIAKICKSDVIKK